MNRLKEFWCRLKEIKHIYIYLAVFVALVLCAIYFATFKTKESDKTGEVSTQEYSSAVEYASYLENKLSNVLSNLSGVESVNVAITLNGDISYEYATDTETKTMVSSGSETTVTTQTTILVSNEPVVVKTIYPNIKGVVVVAKGAENVGVKLNILTAIQTVLEIEPNNITILS